MVSHLSGGAGNPRSPTIKPWLESQKISAGHSTPWRTGHCTNASSQPAHVPVLVHWRGTGKSEILSLSGWNNTVVYMLQTGKFSPG